MFDIVDMHSIRFCNNIAQTQYAVYGYDFFDQGIIIYAAKLNYLLFFPISCTFVIYNSSSISSLFVNYELIIVQRYIDVK
jgi:hypothetical protein